MRGSAGTAQHWSNWSGETSGSGGAAAWSPTSLSGLMLWFDSTDVTSITKDGSNAVSQWNDKSGRAKHATQSTGSLQPTWVSAGRNGRDIIDFVASSTYMAMVSETLISNAAAWTIFWISKADVYDNNFRGQFVFSANSGGYLCGMTTVAGYPDMYLASSAYGVQPNLAVASQTNWHRYVVTHNGSGTYAYYVDGVSVTPTSGSGRNKASSPWLGWDSNTPFDGKIMHFGCTSTQVSGSDLTSLHSWMQTEMG